MDDKGNHTDPAKVAAVQKYPAPTNVTETRAFLGLASYYHRFIKNFSTIARPINQLLKKNAPFNWEQEQEEAFNQLKDSLTTAPILE